MHNLTVTWVGYLSLICFCLAYTLVIFEEQIHMRKSKPVILIGCFMWRSSAFMKLSMEAGMHTTT